MRPYLLVISTWLILEATYALLGVPVTLGGCARLQKFAKPSPLAPHSSDLFPPELMREIENDYLLWLQDAPGCSCLDDPPHVD